MSLQIQMSNIILMIKTIWRHKHFVVTLLLHNVCAHVEECNAKTSWWLLWLPSNFTLILLVHILSTLILSGIVHSDIVNLYNIFIKLIKLIGFFNVHLHLYFVNYTEHLSKTNFNLVQIRLSLDGKSLNWSIIFYF